MIKLINLITDNIKKDVWFQALKDTEKEAGNISVKNWKKFDAKVCNSGFCDIFANKISEKLPGAEMYTTYQSDGSGTFGHIWIKYKGKYYDAEIPNGVKKLEDIPYIKRIGEIPKDIEKI